MISQELIALLEHLDKDHKGHVSLDEFVQALQSLKKSVPVAAYTPPQPIFRRYSDMVRKIFIQKKNKVIAGLCL